MSQYDLGTINPETTSGSVLADKITQWSNAVESSHFGSARPSYITAGGLWTQEYGSTYKVNVYDGVEDVFIGTVYPATHRFAPSTDSGGGSSFDNVKLASVGFNSPTGVGNTGIGNFSLVRLSSGSYNTAVGNYSLTTLSTYTNCSGLGYQASVTGSNQVQLGNSDTTTYVYGTVQNRSDERDKTDIRPTTLGLAFINSLVPIDYKWDMREDYRKPNQKLAEIKKDGSKKRGRYHHGFGASSVKDTMDALGVDFGGYQDHKIAGGEDVLSLGYDEFIAPMVKAIQELSARVEILQEQLNKIKG